MTSPLTSYADQVLGISLCRVGGGRLILNPPYRYEIYTLRNPRGDSRSMSVSMGRVKFFRYWRVS